ncbi:MAG: VWA domain-containing protein [Segetibacter sp.]
MLYKWYQSISFAEPYALSLLLILPILMFWYYDNNRKRHGSMLITTTNFINDIRSSKTLFFNFPFILRCLALACLIVALARPQQKFTETNTEGEGIDIMLCFDISGSMMSKDFEPNRLEASKELAKDFVLSRAGDNIGIVIFSRVSFTLCPLTSYHDAVLSQMENIRSGYLTEEGTAIGSGLATCVDRLKDSKSKSKIIVLMTDGVDYGGLIPPDIAKEMAKLYKIKIYAIGVGSAKELEEIVETPYGTTRQKRTMEFNENLLQELSGETGVVYFNAKNREALKTVYSSIDKLEKSKIKRINYERAEDKFLPWVIAAAVLLFIEAFLRNTVFRKFP